VLALQLLGDASLAILTGLSSQRGFDLARIDEASIERARSCGCP
jgi:hypothetical protein